MVKNIYRILFDKLSGNFATKAVVKPLSRRPLAQQAASWVRAAILSKEWQTSLPGERELSERAGVSRPVMRAGLQVLEEEGVIIREPNRKRRIVSGPSRRIRVDEAPRKVIFLVGADEAISQLHERPVFNLVMEKLWRSRVDTEVRRHPSLERASAGRLLSEWTSAESTGTRWVLLSVTRTVQEWFSQRSLRSLVVGSAYPGIALPSFDSDYRSVGRHAAGWFLGNGHRNIVLFSLDRPRAGDLECEAGFEEACRNFRGEGLRYSTIRTRREPDDFARHLRRVCAGADAPTALLVCHAQLALTAVTHLQTSGLRVPQDVSIICRDEERFLSFTRPAIAHYRHHDDTHARRLARFILGSPRSLRIFPQFVKAGSVAGRPGR